MHFTGTVESVVWVACAAAVSTTHLESVVVRVSQLGLATGSLTSDFERKPVVEYVLYS